ncbi:MAG TPA: adenosine deaminase [Reyranella sp.]|nr:adenosine deaminase [Reyranella sp.]
MTNSRWRGVLPLVLLSATLSACATLPASPPPADNEARAAAYLQQVRDRPPYLEAFLRRMPKGGDLHNHLSGAIYAESFMRWAAQDGLCVVRATFTITKPPCRAPDQVTAAAAALDPVLYGQTIDALSMRNFLPLHESGHDHFFATFAKFSAAGDNHFGDMLAEATDRAAGSSVSYLELMASPGMWTARSLGGAAGWDEDMAKLQAKLLGPKMAALVAETRREIDAAERAWRARSNCGTQAAQPGCAVTVRYLAQVIRIATPAESFGQILFAFELAKADRRVVGLNLVAPEDNKVALDKYDVQMRILGFLHAQMPDVKITLHAGELTPALVPPEALRSHIRSAVEVAGASRIGHGVDVLGEDNAAGLLAEMARRKTMVEINLTSNDTILDVVGARHPFESYRRAGVPLALSTDDEGVSRIDLTNEYRRAVITYGLGYRDLKIFARNSLEYAFLPGESLWRTTVPFAMVDACAGATPGTGAPPPACQQLLGRSEKAAAQWRLETEFARFEASTWPAP